MIIDLEELAAGKPRFAARKVGDELVLVPMKGSVADMDEMFTLNDVGSVVWENLNAEATEDSLVEAVLGVFDVDAETAHKDVRAFLVQLRRMLHD